jgi:hypothetical protein
MPMTLAGFDKLIAEETEKMGQGHPGSRHQGGVRLHDSLGHFRRMEAIGDESGPPPIASKFPRCGNDKQARSDHPCRFCPSSS